MLKNWYFGKGFCKCMNACSALGLKKSILQVWTIAKSGCLTSTSFDFFDLAKFGFLDWAKFGFFALANLPVTKFLISPSIASSTSPSKISPLASDVSLFPDFY